jgi:hypothetical protein
MVATVLFVLGGASFLTGSLPSVDQVIAVLGAVGELLDRALSGLGWPVLGGLGAAVLAGVAVVMIRRRRPTGGFAEPWNTVIEMGRRGKSAAAIARATGLPQDAVRIVLAPIPVDQSRLASPRGKSFRPASDEKRSARSPEQFGRIV